MRADFLLINHQPISALSRLVRPLKNSLVWKYAGILTEGVRYVSF